MSFGGKWQLINTDLTVQTLHFIFQPFSPFYEPETLIIWGGRYRERVGMTVRMLKEGDEGRKERNKNERQVGGVRQRSEVTNLAAILERDISARLRLLINKQYCCEIGLMTK